MVRNKFHGFWNHHCRRISDRGGPAQRVRSGAKKGLIGCSPTGEESGQAGQWPHFRALYGLVGNSRDITALPWQRVLQELLAAIPEAEGAESFRRMRGGCAWMAPGRGTGKRSVTVDVPISLQPLFGADDDVYRNPCSPPFQT